eukprot:TRINITY_DN706_c0_g1_i1.p1 TRINITY_DN706_c0_g1~~TRINITY_DN706_c0_g1_i1.p1  ORF type:complete len:477 (-),score=90.17 TRINITY_DN706_c0_g1_i1:125-1555(-)
MEYSKGMVGAAASEGVLKAIIAVLLVYFVFAHVLFYSEYIRVLEGSAPSKHAMVAGVTTRTASSSEPCECTQQEQQVHDLNRRMNEQNLQMGHVQESFADASLQTSLFDAESRYSGAMTKIRELRKQMQHDADTKDKTIDTLQDAVDHCLHALEEANAKSSGPAITDNFRALPAHTHGQESPGTDVLQAQLDIVTAERDSYAVRYNLGPVHSLPPHMVIPPLTLPTSVGEDGDTTLQFTDIIIGVLLAKKARDEKGITALRTWVPLARERGIVVVFFGIWNDPALPVVKVFHHESKKFLSDKTMGMFRWMWENYPEKKWFMKADDDTYVIPNNLLAMLRRRAPEEVYLGNTGFFPLAKLRMNPGQGYLLAQSALEKMYPSIEDCRPYAYGEDTTVARCLLSVGVEGTKIPGFHARSPACTGQKAIKHPPIVFHHLNDFRLTEVYQQWGAGDDTNQPLSPIPPSLTLEERKDQCGHR